MVVKACECGVMRSDPYPSEEELGRFYRGVYRKAYGLHGPDEEFERERAEGRVYAEIVRRLGCSEAIEIGAGYGGSVMDRGYDPDPGCVEYGKSRGVDMRIGEVPEDRAEVVVMNQVLEHLRDPVARLKEIGSCVGRYLVIAVPGLFTVSTVYGLDLRRYLQFPHAWHFTLETLKQVMARAGFKLVWGNEYVLSVWERGQGSWEACGDTVVGIVKSFETTRLCREAVS